MKFALALVSLLAWSSSALASGVTFKILTTTGKVVDVTEEALKETYSAMVTLDFNNTFKNEDGSTSIVRPAVMFAGEAHLVSMISGGGDTSAQGLCKLRGFSTLVTSEGIGEHMAPSVILRSDGTTESSYEGQISGVYPYRSITCR